VLKRRKKGGDLRARVAGEGGKKGEDSISKEGKKKKEAITIATID